MGCYVGLGLVVMVVGYSGRWGCGIVRVLLLVGLLCFIACCLLLAGDCLWVIWLIVLVMVMFCVHPSYCFGVGFVGYVLGCSFASCVFWYLVRPIGLVFGWFGFRRLGCFCLFVGLRLVILLVLVALVVFVGS